MSAPLSTCLGGALQRRLDGWHWSDGTPEPRVHDETLRHFVPNFRCATYGGGTVVEIPRGWEKIFAWDGDAATHDAIRGLIQQHGTRGGVFAERLADGVFRDVPGAHRLTQSGWTVPIERWDEVMSRVVGCGWDGADQEAILARARELGWKG